MPILQLFSVFFHGVANHYDQLPGILNNQNGNTHILVKGLEHLEKISPRVGMMIQSDELHHFSGGMRPPISGSFQARQQGLRLDVAFINGAVSQVR